MMIRAFTPDLIHPVELFQKYHLCQFMGQRHVAQAEGGARRAEHLGRKAEGSADNKAGDFFRMIV